MTLVMARGNRAVVETSEGAFEMPKSRTLRSISVVTNRFEGLRSRWMPSGVEHNFRSRVVSGHVERSRRSDGVPRAVAKRFARLVAWNPPKAGFPTDSTRIPRATRSRCCCRARRISSTESSRSSSRSVRRERARAFRWRAASRSSSTLAYGSARELGTSWTTFGGGRPTRRVALSTGGVTGPCDTPDAPRRRRHDWHVIARASPHPRPLSLFGESPSPAWREGRVRGRGILRAAYR